MQKRRFTYDTAHGPSWAQTDQLMYGISATDQRLLVGRSIILYSQRTIKVLIKLSGMICIFIVGISQKRESVILILILFGTYDMYIMVYKSSNYKQWPGIVFWYSQIQNPVQTKIKTLKYFNYITLSSTDIFFLQLFDYIYVCLYIWKQSTRQALLLKRKIYCCCFFLLLFCFLLLFFLFCFFFCFFFCFVFFCFFFCLFFILDWFCFGLRLLKATN